MKKVVWTDAIDAILIRLWDEGLSLLYVAGEMNKLGYNVTRNSIAGRKHRLRQQGKMGERVPGSYADNVVNPAKPKPRNRNPVKRDTKVMPYIVNTIIAPPAGEVDHDNGVDYTMNPENGCKAMLDVRGSDGLFKCCGRARVDDYKGNRSPYCQKHYHSFFPQTLRSAYG